MPGSPRTSAVPVLVAAPPARGSFRIDARTRRTRGWPCHSPLDSRSLLPASRRPYPELNWASRCCKPRPSPEDRVTSSGLRESDPSGLPWQSSVAPCHLGRMERMPRVELGRQRLEGALATLPHPQNSDTRTRTGTAWFGLQIIIPRLPHGCRRSPPRLPAFRHVAGALRPNRTAQPGYRPGASP
jgi:hypothetical protein